jgi:monovalent cation/hydrogen antiporter
MQSFEVVLLLISICVGLGLLSRKLGLPYPIFLVVGGLVLSWQPWSPELPGLDPNIVLLFFLPPLLYAAAFRTNWKSFRSNFRAISLLAVGLVLFTTVIVAVVAHELIGLPWAVCFVLGAVVSPPDAVAAMAITQQVKVPEVTTTILEGESLVNDASALVAYRIAIATVLGGSFSLLDAGLKFALVSSGGLLLGFLGALVVVWFHNWLNRQAIADSKLTITITLLTPFALYFIAEHLHVSGVLAVVTAGLWVGHRCHKIFADELFREAVSVWEMVEFLLNSLIFILIGLQLPKIVEQLDDQYSPWQLTGFALAISAAMIFARLVWMFPGAYFPRWIDKVLLGKVVKYPPWQYVAVVGWTGMRGVVSLAAAMALPLVTQTGEPFPGRALIQFLTFWAIFATLVGQGLTLPLLIRWLGVDRMAEHEAETREKMVQS